MVLRANRRLQQLRALESERQKVEDLEKRRRALEKYHTARRSASARGKNLSKSERKAAQQRLYARKPANWIEWDAAQAARVKCATAWAAADALPHAARVVLLKEYLVRALPPPLSPAQRPEPPSISPHGTGAHVPYHHAARPRGHHPQAEMGSDP